MSCESAHLDGAYVLDALAPAERQEFERHLEGCAACAASVRELAGLPGLLGRVDAASVEFPPDAVPVPATLLPALVHEVRRVQRRRRLLSVAVAAAVVVVVALGIFVTTRPSGPAPDPVVPTAGRVMQTVVPGPLSARLELASVAWGTRLDLVCTYAVSGYHDGQSAASTYALVVHTRDGGTEQVATWRGLPGKTLRLTAATAATREEITSVEVRTLDGNPVLTLVT